MSDLAEDSHAPDESERYQRWVAASRRPLDALALVFLVDLLLMWSFPDATGGWFELFQGISWFVWGAFVVDYLVRLALSAHRGAFVRTHKIDLAMVLLPMLRLLRVALLLRRSLASVSTERIASSIVSIAVIVVAVIAWLVWRVESVSPDANITTFRESLWWAVVTVTTVGYGNYYPVTPKGQILATALMLVGISLIGTISATVAAWFVRRPTAAMPAPDAVLGDAVPVSALATSQEVASLLARLDDLAAEQAAIRALLEHRIAPP